MTTTQDQINSLRFVVKAISTGTMAAPFLSLSHRRKRMTDGKLHRLLAFSETPVALQPHEATSAIIRARSIGLKTELINARAALAQS